MAISKKIQKVLDALEWNKDIDISLVSAGLRYVSFSICGDWKHSHIYFENRLEYVCRSLGLTCKKVDVIMFEDGGGDWYGAIKKFRIE